MKKLMSLMIIISFVFLCVSLASAADIPMMLNYQGYVEDSGVPVNGDGYFKFAIVDPNGTTYWSNDEISISENEPDNAVTIPITDGFFTIKLGNTDFTNMSALSPDVFDQQNIFVRVWFSTYENGPFEQLSPDTQIISSGFAYKAQTALEADKLDGKDASDFALEDHIHEYDYAAFTHTHIGKVTETIYDDGDNVGIGTTNPVSKLDVNGSIRIDTSTGGPYLELITNDSNAPLGSTSSESNRWLVGAQDDNHDSQPGQFLISRNTGTSWNQVFNITSEGYVGIGTTNPQSTLNLYKTGTWGPYIRFNRPDLINHAMIGPRDYNNDLLIANYDPNGGICLGTDGKERVNITNSGNVGIGIDEPGAKLDVGGGMRVKGNYAQIIIEAPMQPRIRFNQTGADPNSNSNWAIRSRPDLDHSLYFQTYGLKALGISNNIDVMAMQTNGNVIIYKGNLNILAGSLDVKGGANFHGNIVFEETKPNDNVDIVFPQTDYDEGRIYHMNGNMLFCTNGIARVIIDPNGNVGIGTTSPSKKLDVAGNVIATDYYHHSDARLKKDIITIDNALVKVLALRGVEFKWQTEEYPEKGLDEGRKIGLIAQEVEEVLPEVVSTDNEGYKALAYGNIVGVLIEAVKAQQAQIEALQSRIEALEKW